MLSDKQKQAIELLVTTDLNYGEIAERIDVHRNTLLRWREDEKFKNEIDLVVQSRCKFLEDKIKLETENLFHKALVMIDKAESEHVKADLLKYLMDRGLGKASTKIEMSVEPKINEQQDKEEFLDLLDKQEQEQDNENIVDVEPEMVDDLEG